MRRLLWMVLAGIAGLSIARADGALDRLLTAFDKDRLARFDPILAEALAEARAGGEKEDVALLDSLLEGKPLPLAEDFDPVGDWRCRIIKVGGTLPLTVYPWFKSRISDDGAGWVLEKLTGSQRTKGRFYTLSATRLAYAGAGFTAGERAPAYGENAGENQVAIVERRDRNRILLLFPAPQRESKLDIMVLER